MDLHLRNMKEKKEYKSVFNRLGESYNQGKQCIFYILVTFFTLLTFSIVAKYHQMVPFKCTVQWH